MFGLVRSGRRSTNRWARRGSGSGIRDSHYIAVITLRRCADRGRNGPKHLSGAASLTGRRRLCNLHWESTGVFYFRRNIARACVWDLSGRPECELANAASIASHCIAIGGYTRGPFGVRVKKNEQRGNESSWFSGDRQTARQTD